MLVRFASDAVKNWLKTEVHNATKTNDQNKDNLTDAKPGYVLSMFS